MLMVARTVFTTDISHLRSSSLSELASHIDSIQTEIASVLQVARRVMEECKVRSISENIGASLSKIEALCHQLCLVAKFKFKHCQGENACIHNNYIVFDLRSSYS